VPQSPGRRVGGTPWPQWWKANRLCPPWIIMTVSLKTRSPRIMAMSVVAGIGAGALLAGCGASTPASTSTGTLRGEFETVTGGVEYRTVPGVGYVIVRQGSRRLVNHEVSSGNTFKFMLPAGSFQVGSSCLQSPQETQFSESKTVAIRANMDTRIEVQCLLNPTAG
jgi:hypothetical protein